MEDVMKKLVTYAVMLTYLAVTFQPVQAQSSGQSASAVSEKPKIAVYVSEHSGYSDEEKSALRTAALNTLVRSGRYQVIERSNVIAAELMRQASGAVDDDMLTAFGKQLGVPLICVADMTLIREKAEPVYCTDRMGEKYLCGNKSYHDYQVSVRLIDVETAEVLAFGLVEHDIQNGAALSNAVVDAINKMLGTVQEAKAPDIPKMAVYVTGGRAGHRSGNALYSYVLGALFARSRKLDSFKVIERSEAFTRQIDREQTTQRSGHIDDNQIARIGKQYGIEWILIANMDYAMNTYNISARIINVETASVEKASALAHTNDQLVGLGEISTKMVEEMLGLSKAEKAKAEASANAIKYAKIGAAILGVIVLMILIF
jgi:hypothetical protein